MITNNFVFKNLMINVALVIIGYALAGITNSASNTVFQPLKLLFLLYSLYALKSKFMFNRKVKNVIIFGLLILLTIPFSISPSSSLSRFSTLIVPLFYIVQSLSILCNTYSWDTIYINILKAFRIIYVIPSIAFIFGGGYKSVLSFNIYGQEIGGFVSNHFGWAAFLFISSHWILLSFNEKKFRAIWSCISLINFVLILISGSRSGLISLILFLFLWLLMSKYKLVFKFLFFFPFLYLGYVMINNQNIVTINRFDKTIREIEAIEMSTVIKYKSNSVENFDTRSSAREIAFITFRNKPILNFFGMGIFQFREGIKKHAKWAYSKYYKSGIHNSYGELYFGCGVFVFIFFVIQFILKPLLIYFKYLTKYMHYVPGIFIIPFFESNLTGGQFLFYPWFITVFLLLFYKKTINA